MQSLVLIQFVTRQVHLDAGLFAGIARFAIFHGVRSRAKFLPPN